MVAEFRRWGRDAVPQSTVQAQYIAIVCMLRSVGHVLEKIDCTAVGEKQFLKARWPLWKQEKIFQTFIEPARNDLLKEFKGGLELQKTEDVSRVFFATPGSPTGSTVALTFEADLLKDIHGRKVLALFKEAIAFWNTHLAEVETFRSSQAGP